MKKLHILDKYRKLRRDQRYLKRKNNRKRKNSTRADDENPSSTPDIKITDLKLSSGYKPVTRSGGVLCINAPPICDIDQHPNDFFEFISQIKSWHENPVEFFEQYMIKSHRQRMAINFSQTKEITFAFALVLVAELSFIFKSPTNRLTKKLFKQWKNEVVITLNNIGFFDYFNVKNVKLPKGMQNEIKTLKVEKLNAFGADEKPIDSGKKTKAFAEKLKENLNFGVNEGLASALSEAVNNVQEHAYEKNTSDAYYWILGAQKEQNLRLFVYDRGRGIPESMKKDDRWKRIIDMLEIKTDVDLIKTTMEEGESRTKQPHRGLGLPFILKNLKQNNNRTALRIFSGKAIFRADEQTEEGKLLDFNFDGTLIEWIFDLDV